MPEDKLPQQKAAPAGGPVPPSPQPPKDPPPPPPASRDLSPEEQMAQYEESLKETDWGHQPC